MANFDTQFTTSYSIMVHDSMDQVYGTGSQPPMGELPLRGEQYSALGGPYSAPGGQYPAQGGQYPAPGGQYPAQGGQYSAQGGHYPSAPLPQPDTHRPPPTRPTEAEMFASGNRGGYQNPAYPNPEERGVNELDVLRTICAFNCDDGIEFTDKSRLDRIADMLRVSPYKKLNNNGLFHLYGRMDKLSGRVLVLSTHVDCEKNVRRCSAVQNPDGSLQGTLDNLITNAAAVTLMLRSTLPYNVLVGFTGDAKEDGIGALQLARFLENHEVKFSVVVLRVSWVECGDAAFTIENNRWEEDLGRTVITWAESCGNKWRFVPADLTAIPPYVPRAQVIAKEAEADETDSYDDKDIKCFSLCLPVVRVPEGAIVSFEIYHAYIQAVQGIANILNER